jgi:hypothetical protein
MEKVEVKGHVYGKLESWATKPRYDFFGGETVSEYLISDGWFHVTPYTLSFDVVTTDVKALRLTALYRQKEAIIAKFTAAINEVSEQIKKHEAIEFDSSVIDVTGDNMLF